MVGERRDDAWLEHALTWVLAAMVFLFVAGSSSVVRLRHVGSTGRWALLFVLWFVGAALVLRARPRGIERVPWLLPLALALPVLGLASAAWSVDPRVTIGRAVSLGVLVTACALIGWAAVGNPTLIGRAIDGVVAGAGVAAVAGGILLVFDYGEAMQSSFAGTAARYRGIGENPNTVAMLAAVCLPLAAWIAASPRTHPVRMAAGVTWIGLYCTIIASSSRGGFVAATAGMVVLVALSGSIRRRLVAVVAVLVVFAAGLFVTQLLPTPPPAPVATSPAQPSQSGHGRGGKANGNPADRTLPGRLQDESGRPWNGAQPSRTLFSSSGRFQAWKGAVEQADQRPILGYGFGTESHVFLDRFYFFEGGSPENSWVGMYMQLGAAGVALLLSIWIAAAAIVVPLLRSRERSDLVVAIVGTIAAGLIVTLPQSYIYSVGNVATGTVWLALGLLAALATRLRQETPVRV